MRYAFIDLETTHSDEQAGSILEVGLIITDENFDEIHAQDWIVRPARGHLDQMPDVVRDMHQYSGLLAALATGRSSLCEHVDVDISNALDEHRLVDHQFILAGSGVGHFDSRWIRLHLPKTARQLTYWTIDVGVLRRFLEFVVGVDLGEPPDKPHRALDDARLHLDEARRYRSMVAGAFAAAVVVEDVLPSVDARRARWCRTCDDEPRPACVLDQHDVEMEPTDE
jgi:oligoribonuclease